MFTENKRISLNKFFERKSLKICNHTLQNIIIYLKKLNFYIRKYSIEMIEEDINREQLKILRDYKN